MTWALLLPSMIAVVVSLVGIGVTHWFSSRRDYQNDRRKLRIQYLIDAYRLLESASNRPNSEAVRAKIESAIADIQLLGSAHQADLARQFALQMASDGGSSLDELICDLRNSLRKELSLDAVTNNPVYLRYKASGKTHS